LLLHAHSAAQPRRLGSSGKCARESVVKALLQSGAPGGSEKCQRQATCGNVSVTYQKSVAAKIVRNGTRKKMQRQRALRSRDREAGAVSSTRRVTQV